MKPPSPEGLPRIDVSTAELEALLEQGRPSLGEDGYQKPSHRGSLSRLLASLAPVPFKKAANAAPCPRVGERVIGPIGTEWRLL